LYTEDEDVHTAFLLKEKREDKTDDFNKRNKRAYAQLVQVLNEKSLQHVMRDAKDDGMKAFKILKEHYASTQKLRVPTLYEQLTTIKLIDTEDITDYLIYVKNYSAGLKSAGENVSNISVIAMIMKRLPTSYIRLFYIVIVRTQLNRNQTLSELKAALTNFNLIESARCSQSTAMVIFKGR